MGESDCVYLLHFAEPLAHARHYLGSTSCLELRLNAHAHGAGARLMQVCYERGISWELARIWPASGRELERRLKRQKHGPRLCPLCQQQQRARQQQQRARQQQQQGG